jgi:hypothetical protein
MAGWLQEIQCGVQVLSLLSARLAGRPAGGEEQQSCGGGALLCSGPWRHAHVRLRTAGIWRTDAWFGKISAAAAGTELCA